MQSVAKAQAWAGAVRARGNVARARAAFGPPPGGASFYGTQGYRWQQVIEGYRHWSFVAIRVWMETIAGGDHPQVGLLFPKGKGTERSKSWAKHRGVRKATLGGPGPNHEFHELDPDDPMVRVFRKPNAFDVAYDFWSYAILFYKLCGYVAVWVMRDERGMPREMWPIPTHWIQMLRTGRDSEPDCFAVQSPWGQRLDVPYSECLVLQEHSPLSRYEGYATSIAIAEWLDTYESLVRVRLAQFKNGAVPNIHVALGETYSDPDEAFLARFYAKWFARFQGENQAGLPLITGPDIEVKPIGNVPYELFQNEEESIRTEVLAAYGVPQALVTGDPTVDTSAYAPQRTFARYKVNKCLKYFGEKFGEEVVKKTPGYENGCVFWPDQAPDDPQLELQRWTSKLDRGAASPNEWRAADGQEPYPHGGDDPMLNGAPVPWATGRRAREELNIDSEVERLVTEDRSMGEGAGAAGGYLTVRDQLRGLARNGKH